MSDGEPGFLGYDVVWCWRQWPLFCSIFGRAQHHSIFWAHFFRQCCQPVPQKVAHLLHVFGTCTCGVGVNATKACWAAS